MKLFFACVSVLLLFGCGGGVSKGSDDGFDTLYCPRYASHFVVLARGEQVVLRVENPWQGADSVSFDYALQKEARRIVVMSSSHGAFIEALGGGDAIVGVSGPQYISSARLRELPDVGYDNNVNYELLVELSPDLMCVYEIAGENSSANEKLASLGINTIHIADYLENSPLAKAEWVVAFGAILGRMEQAQQIFGQIESRYTLLRDSIADAGGVRPEVMLNSPYKDVWYLPGDSSYIVQLITDAGGNYVGRGVPDNVSRAVGMEVAYEFLQKADVWLNPAAAVNSKADLKATNALLSDVKIPVYNNTARGGKSGGSDFWESGVLRCDVVLRDVAAILHRGGESSRKLFYYKEIR